MSELGRLQVTVTANIGDLERKMSAASSSIQRLTAAQQAAASNPALQTALVRMGAVAATAGNAVAGLTQQTRAMTLTHMRAIAMNEALAAPIANVGRASTASAFNVGKLNGAFRAMAQQAIGVSGPVGRVADVLGGFAIGAAPMLAVLLGLAAVAKAWELITAKSREAKKVQDSAVAAARAIALEQKNGLQGGSLSTLQGVNAALAEANNKLKQLRGDAAGIGTMSLGGAFDSLKEALPWADTLAERIKATEGFAAEMQSLQAAMNTQMATDQKGADDKLLSDAESANAKRLRAEEKFQKSLEQIRLKAAAVAVRMSQLGTGQLLTPSGVGPIKAVQATGAGGRLAGEGTTGGGWRDEASQGFLKDMMAGLKGGIGNAVKEFGPLALAAAALAPVLQGLASVIGPILTEPLRMLGQLIGTAILPVVKLLAVPLRLLNIGVSYVVEALGWFIEALGKFVDKIVPDWISKAGKGLAQMGQDMQDSARAARKNTAEADKVSEAFERLAGSSSNMPSGFKIQQARFNASAGVMPTGGGMNINGPIYVVADDPQEMLRKIEQEAQRKAARGGTGLTLGYAG